MSSHINLSKTVKAQTKNANTKHKKNSAKPEWNSEQTDLNKYKLSEAEIVI